MNTQIRKKQSNNTFMNVSAINPTISDDSSLGFDATSQWFNSVSKIIFVCEDASVGAAVWTASVGSGGGVGTNGIASRTGNTASGVQNIPHGLSYTPDKVRLIVRANGSTNPIISDGTFINSLTTTASVFLGDDGTVGNSSTQIIIMINNSGVDEQRATITVDATNIILNWTISGSGISGTMFLEWETK